MAFIADAVFDAGLAVIISNGTVLNICSAEPANFAGIAAVNLGNKTVTCTAAADGAVDGRRTTVPAITDGAVTADGTAAFYALSNGTTTLYASGSLSATQAVTNGNTFTLDEIIIALRDAASV